MKKNKGGGNRMKKIIAALTQGIAMIAGPAMADTIENS